MRIPDKFLKKHARPGETMGQARRRLMREFMKQPDTHADPEKALKRLDTQLVEREKEKLAASRRSWEL